MVTMKWKKDAAGRLAAEWKGETLGQKKPARHFHKVLRTKFKTPLSAHARRVRLTGSG